MRKLAKRRAEEKDARQANDVDEDRLAHTGLVARLRPQGLGCRVEKSTLPVAGGGSEEGEVFVIELGIPGALVDVEIPLDGAPGMAAAIWEAYKAHKGITAEEGSGLVQATGQEDVRRAAEAAAAAERLRGE